jgi:hypothetical protein
MTGSGPVGWGGQVAVRSAGGGAPLGRDWTGGALDDEAGAPE